MCLPAGLFAWAHLFWIPKGTSPTYQLMVDSRLPLNLLRYIGWTIGPSDLPTIDAAWQRLGLGVTWAIGAALALFAITRWMRQERAVLFCGGWFVLFLAPLLLLPNHVSAYYLTIPGIGLAWIGGWALASSRATISVAAVILAGAYWIGSIAQVNALTTFHLRITSRMRILVRGLERSVAAHPGQAMVLQGVDEELFGAGFRDDPFVLVGLRQVYLAPGNDDEILNRAEFRGATHFRTTREELLGLLEGGQARVLHVSLNVVRDVTLAYRSVLRAEFLAAHRRVVDAANPLYGSRLGAGWYEGEGGSPWIGKRGSVTLEGPETGSEKLYITGYAAPGALEKGPLTLTVRVAGKQLATATVKNAGQPFVIEAALPAELRGVYSMEVTVEGSRTFRPSNDPRELGIVLAKFEVR